jgi:hypothetical protein
MGPETIHDQRAKNVAQRIDLKEGQGQTTRQTADPLYNYVASLQAHERLG